jgi:outer membrane receptor for ferrienterochelin and colicins
MSRRFAYHLARLISVIWVFVTVSFAPAQDVPDLSALRELSIEELIEIKIPTVYGASKQSQKITEAPASVTIVTKDDIQMFGHRTLADVLRSVRDFYVTYDRQAPHVGVRGFNRPDDYGGRTLFLVDGHRINEVAHDSVSVGAQFPVDIDMVERVEIIRGPGSVLYGTNAFFGVINVITRKGSDLNGLEASAEAGSFESYKGRLSYGKVFKNGLSITLTGSAFQSAGDDFYVAEFDQPENNHGIARGRDGAHAYSAGATIRYKDFTLQSTYMEAEKDIPTASYNSAYNMPNVNSHSRSFTRLSYEHEFEDELTLKAALYWDYYRSDSSFTSLRQRGFGLQHVEVRDTSKAEWWGADLEVSKRILNTHRLTAGINYRDTSKLEFLTKDLAPEFVIFQADTSSTTIGGFIQDEWKVTDKLTLNAGLSYDWFDTFGSTINPRGALIFQPTDRTTLKLIYGEAFRAPNIFESRFVVPDGAVQGSLRPEQIESYELLLEQSVTRNLRLTASVFNNQISDLISLETNPDATHYFYANSGDAETTGGSVEVEASLPRGIKARTSYTLQHTTDSETGRRLSHSPEHLAKLNLLVPIYKGKVFSGLELQYASETENPRGEKTNGYLLTNWTLYGREIVRGLDASIGVYNLFDAEYADPGGSEHRQPRIIQDGRTFRIKFTYRF